MVLAAGLAGWATQGSAADVHADAALKTAAGAPAGTATVTQTTDGLQVTVKVEGLPPGSHGVHVHTVGRCDAPDFASAGGHWNPGQMQHGLDNPKGHHAGDMPNLTVGADGKGMLAYVLPGAKLDALLDADGAALVVHATTDDQKTDPSGNSGGRIACGVFAK
jgi:Cu-Zn family superoxide dismutase